MIDLLVDLKELIQLKTYKGHKGRPGKKGGSLPKGQSATKFVDESDQDNKKYWNTTVDKIGMPNGSVKNAYVASGRLVQSYGQNTDQAELDRLFTEKTGQKMDYRYDEEWGGGWSENSGYTINEEYYPDNDSPDASMYHIVKVADVQLTKEDMDFVEEVSRKKTAAILGTRKMVADLMVTREGLVVPNDYAGADKPLAVSKKDAPDDNDKLRKVLAPDDMEELSRKAFIFSDDHNPGKSESEKAFAKAVGDLKDSVVQRLAKETGLDYQTVNTVVGSWASSSNMDPNSAALQCAAQKVFGSKISDWQVDSLPGTLHDQQEADNFGMVELPPVTPEEFQQKIDTCAKVLKAMYKITQEKLQGIKTVTLWRGVGVHEKNWHNHGRTIKTEGNALESWTTDKNVAVRFGIWSGGMDEDIRSMVLEAKVPVERIVSMPQSGFGCYNEEEVVILGGTSDKDKAKVA